MARIHLLTLLTAFILSLSLQTIASPSVLTAQSDAVHTTGNWNWEDCGSPDYPVSIKSISLSPDPPQPGQDLTVTVTGTVVQTIQEGAYADVTVKVGLVKLLRKDFDVCEEARKANATVQCPVEPGDYEVSQTVALPKEIPRAKFTVDVLGFTVDDEEMVCLKLKINFMPFLDLSKWGF